MFVIGHFLAFLAEVLKLINGYILSLILLLMLIRAVISWVNPDPYNTVVQFLYKTTEPILYPIRRFLPLDFRFGIDISPIIAFFIIKILQYFLMNFLVPTLSDLSKSFI